MRDAGQQGYSLVELMIVSSLFLIVLVATLGAATSSERVSAATQSRDWQVDGARRGVDRTMRELRNLARRIDVPVIQRATADDLIFQTSDPQRTWVRTCLETRIGGETRLWSSTSATSLTTGMKGTCPGTGWQRSDVMAEDVANMTPGRTFPIFSYGCAAGAATPCPATAADLTRIRTVTMDLWIDEDPARSPAASRMTSAVFLRNQNEPPVASFTARPVTSRQVTFNATASVDPEGRTLRFMWFRAPAPAFTCDVGALPATLLWQGVTMTHTFAPEEGLSGTQRSFELVVCDAGGLQARAVSAVNIP